MPSPEPAGPAGDPARWAYALHDAWNLARRLVRLSMIMGVGHLLVLSALVVFAAGLVCVAHFGVRVLVAVVVGLVLEVVVAAADMLV